MVEATMVSILCLGQAYMFARKSLAQLQSTPRTADRSGGFVGQRDGTEAMASLPERRHSLRVCKLSDDCLVIRRC